MLETAKNSFFPVGSSELLQETVEILAVINAVRGYADTRLRAPKAPLDARNRRISIVCKAPPGSDPGSDPDQI